MELLTKADSSILVQNKANNNMTVVFETTEFLMPIVPSGGLVIEF